MGLFQSYLLDKSICFGTDDTSPFRSYSFTAEFIIGEFLASILDCLKSISELLASQISLYQRDAFGLAFCLEVIYFFF